jgi:hypothetical protein
MSKKFHNINFLGHIPFNPDLLLEKGRFRDRPVGVLYTDLIKMYWTVRSFQVDISLQVVAQDDALSAFLMGGGAAGGITAALGGLAVATQSAGGSSNLSLNGHTKILNKYEKYVRNIATSSIPFEGVKNGKLDFLGENLEELQKDPEIKNNPLTSINLKPTEASLCVAGPVHRISKSGAFLSIDFSDIIYFKRKYWPKIIFLASTSQSNFTSNPLRAYGGMDLEVFGSIGLLDSYNIPIYANIECSANRLTAPFAIVNGSIKPGNRCCDRFFYDGFDEIRFEECKEVCGDDIKGVYNKEKTK